MVWCLLCGTRSASPVCRPCAVTMVPAGARQLDSGITVTPAVVHRGAARRLVLRVKYQGCRESAEVLGAMMASLLPDDARALAPIPRIYLRRVRYRSDPALLLAAAVSRRCGLPVLRILGPRLLGGANAGRRRSARTVRFRRRWGPPPGLVLVDDVITTGTTLETAVSTLGSSQIQSAVTATVSI